MTLLPFPFCGRSPPLISALPAITRIQKDQRSEIKEIRRL